MTVTVFTLATATQHSKPTNCASINYEDVSNQQKDVMCPDFISTLSSIAAI